MERENLEPKHLIFLLESIEFLDESSNSVWDWLQSYLCSIQEKKFLGTLQFLEILVETSVQSLSVFPIIMSNTNFNHQISSITTNASIEIKILKIKCSCFQLSIFPVKGRNCKYTRFWPYFIFNLCEYVWRQSAEWCNSCFLCWFYFENA